MRPNKIRIVSPPAGSGPTPASGGGAESPRELPDRPRDAKRRANADANPKRTLPLARRRPADPPRSPEREAAGSPQGGARSQGDGDRARASGQVVRRPHLLGGRSCPGEGRRPCEGKSPAPIIVIPGPNGLTITSEDLEALDEFERLLARRPADRAMGPWRSFTSSTPRPKPWPKSSTGFSPAGRPNPTALPTRAAYASASRKALATGPIKITPETRLNALLVLANRADQDTIEQLLKILDLKKSPEDIAVAPKPRMIPVEHARAKDIADVLRQVYADRMVAAGQDQQQGRGGFFRCLDGGNGRRRSRRRWRSGGGGFGGGGAVRAGRTGATRQTESRSASTPARTPWSSPRPTPVRRGQAVGPATRHGGGRAKRNGAGGHPASHQRGGRREGLDGFRRRRRANQ